MVARRVDTAGAADLLGVTRETIYTYKSAGGFPTKDTAGTYSVTELRAWAADRPGRGAKGTRKTPKGKPCTRCGTVVSRRKKDGDDFLCKKCWVQAGEIT